MRTVQILETVTKLLVATAVIIFLTSCTCSNNRESTYRGFISSSDTNIVYVSHDTGNDNTGLPVLAKNVSNPINPDVTIYPFKTLSAAVAQLRDGHPDWILLKRDEEWHNQSFGNFRKSGRSASEPMILAYYGETGKRPVIKAGHESALNSAGKTTSNIAIIGLDFYAHTRDPSSPDYIDSGEGGTGLRFVGGGNNILIDDTIVRFFKTNVVVQSWGGNHYSNFTLRRSMILDSYSYPNVSHSQGMFISGVDGILIEENLFDQNGWSPRIANAEATKFNHNLYIQSDNIGNNIIVQNNISARASSHGLYGRPGGLYQDNLVVENSIGIEFGYNQNYPLADGAIGTAKNNVILSGKHMNTTGTYSLATKAIWGIRIDPYALDNNGSITIENNIVANVKDYGESQSAINLVGDAIYTDNIIHKWNPSEDMENVDWSEPDRNIDDYMTSIDEEPSLEAYLTKLRARELTQWDDKYSAPTVNHYIRSGFQP